MTTSLSKKAIGFKHGFRSGLEKRVSEELAATSCGFTYEEEKIDYLRPARQCKYTPDFIINTRPDGTPRAKPLIIETKGRFLTDDRQKHILIRDQQPDMDIRFVFSNSRQRISKTSKTSYAMWCQKHNFLFADYSIPEEWLWE